MEDAELEGCEVNFRDRDFARVEWTLLLLAETDESWDALLSKDAACSGSMSHYRRHLGVRLSCNNASPRNGADLEKFESIEGKEMWLGKERRTIVHKAPEQQGWRR
jgi:hypothetical protein